MREAVPAGDLEKERAFLTEQAAESGKPAQVVEKMVEGRIKKSSRKTACCDQAFVKDPDITVGDYVRRRMVSEIGENIRVRRYARFELGEGLEKRSDGLRAEVAAQMKGA